MLAMIESGSLDPHVLRRCLLDAVTAHDKSSGAGSENFAASQAVHAQTVKLIDGLLRQIDAVAPSRPATAGSSGHKAETV
jgi:hypothetical protein